MRRQRFEFKISHAYQRLFAYVFCKQFLAYTVHIDWCHRATHKHLIRSQHTSILS